MFICTIKQQISLVIRITLMYFSFKGRSTDGWSYKELIEIRWFDFFFFNECGNKAVQKLLTIKNKICKHCVFISMTKYLYYQEKNLDMAFFCFSIRAFDCFLTSSKPLTIAGSLGDNCKALWRHSLAESSSFKSI